MRKPPTTEDFRRFAFALQDAGREMKRADAGDAGEDDGMADRMFDAGVSVHCSLAKPTPQRKGEAAEAMRFFTELVNSWAAYLAGDTTYSTTSER
jgi:hypothetical protein